MAKKSKPKTKSEKVTKELRDFLKTIETSLEEDCDSPIYIEGSDCCSGCMFRVAARLRSILKVRA